VNRIDKNIVSRNNKEKILKLIIYFIAFQFIFLGLKYLIERPFMQTFKIEEFISNDLSFNDLYYRIQNRNIFNNKHFNREKSVVLVNTGSLNNDSFRFGLAEIIKKLEKFNPKAIGIDFNFSTEQKPGTDELITAIENNSNIVTAFTPYTKENLKFNDKTIVGDITLSDQTNSIRYYSFSEASFAFQLVKSAYPDRLISLKARDKFFPIHYCCIHDGLIHYNSEEAVYEDINFKYIEAAEVFLDSINLKAFFDKKIVIIGHLGSNCLFDRNDDMADKHCVPTDTTAITGRYPVMYGAVIHANAIENILHQETAFKSWNGFWFKVVMNLFYIAFLAYFLFIPMRKFYKYLILAMATIPCLYIVIWLMNKGIYITMGTTLIKLWIIEEMSAIINPYYDDMKRFFSNIKFSKP
jgi:CHASE2 domain